MKNIMLRPFRAALLFAVPGSLALQALQAQALNPNEFTHKMEIVFSGCGVGEDSALERFPALVVFDSSEQPTFSYAGFASPATGADLRFADEGGAEIPYEIDTWDSAGRSLVWVRVPSLHSNAVVSAYWGSNAHAAPVYAGADNVWANGYVGVWHGNNAAASVLDSSAKANHFTTLTGDVTPAAAAVAGGGVGSVISFGGGESWLSAADDASLNSMSEMTVEALVYDTFTQNNDARTILSKRTNMSDGRVLAFFKLSAAMALDVGSTRAQAVSGLSQHTWTHLAMTFDSGIADKKQRVDYYRDGVWISKAPNSDNNDFPAATGSSTAPLYMGVLNAGDGRGWQGQLDEVRLSNVARSAAWLGASRATMAEPLAFAEYGAAELVNTDLPTLATLPVVAGADEVALRGLLVSHGSSPATVTTYWWQDGAAATNAVAPARVPVEGVEFSDALSVGAGGDLSHARAYHVRHHAVNAATNAWSPEAVAFTTLGAPVLGAPSGVATASSAEFSVMLEDIGAATSVAVECRMGESPDALTTVVKTWTGLGSGDAGQELSCSASGLAIGVTYFYAFFASGPMSDDPANIPVTATDVGSVTTTGVTTWTNATTGDWRDAANWDNGVPGIAATANFYQPAVTAIVTAASGDLAVKEALVNAAGAMVFDLGAGRKFVVADSFDIGGNPAPGYPVASDSAVRLASGELDLSTATLNFGSTVAYTQNSVRNSLTVESGATLRVKAVKIGRDAQSSRVTHATNSFLAVIGPGAALLSETIDVGIGHRSDANMLIVQNAALTNELTMNIGAVGEGQFMQAIFRNSRVHNKGGVYFASGFDNSHSRIVIDEGTVFDIGGSFTADNGSRGNGNRLVVNNATLNIANNFELVGNSDTHDFKFLIEGSEAVVNAAGLNFNNAQSGHILVDRGALNIRNAIQIGTWDGRNLGLVISNGVVTAAHTRLNLSNNSAPRHNFVEIAGPDGRLNTGTFTIGHSKGGPNNYLHINGGALAATGAVTIGNADCSNNTLRVSAPTSKLTAPTMSLANHTRLVYDLPEEGFANGVDGESVLKLAGAVTMDASSSIEINAGRFVGRARLLQSGAPLPDLTGKIAVDIARGSSCKIIIPPDNSYLEINCTRDGTVIVVR